MDKCKLLEEVEGANTSKTKLGLKVLSFCFCTVFLGSVLLNVYYIYNGVHNGHNSRHGHGLALDRNSKNYQLEMNRQEKRSFKKQCDGTDCGNGYCCNDADFPVCCPDGIWCGATADDCPSSIRKFLPKMAADKNARQVKRSSKKQCDGTDCGTGYCCDDPDYPVCCPDTDYYTNWCGATADDCPSSVRKFLPKMAADKRSSKKQCDGTDCGTGYCCDDPDYPVCCPDTDYYTNWCGATADDCPSSIKKLPTMAADKRSSKKDCDGTDCGNGWCCNESDYPVCCPVADDGTQWCADVDDDCPSSIKKFLPKMAADKNDKEYCGGGYCYYPYYCCTDGWSYYCCS